MEAIFVIRGDIMDFRRIIIDGRWLRVDFRRMRGVGKRIRIENHLDTRETERVNYQCTGLYTVTPSG